MKRFLTWLTIVMLVVLSPVVGVCAVYVAKVGSTVYFEDGATDCAGISALDTAGDIEAAMAAAGDGGTVYLCAGIYSGTDLDAADGIDTLADGTITIEGVDSTVELRESINDNIFSVTGENLTLRSLRISNAANGFRAVRVVNNSGGERTVEIDDCVLTENTGQNIVGGTGSALYAVAVDPLILNVTDSEISSNQSRGNGGAVYLSGNVTPTFANDSVTGNKTETGNVSNGGAIWAQTLIGVLTIDGGEYFLNQSGGSGGAVAADNSSIALVNSPNFHDNLANYEHLATWAGGGAVYVIDSVDDASANTALFDAPIFSDNSNGAQAVNEGDGGAVRVGGRDATDVLAATFLDGIYSRNFSDIGGAVHATVYSVVTHTRDKFYDNIARRSGGAVIRGGADAGNEGVSHTTFNYCLFDGNIAGADINGTPLAVESAGGAVLERPYPKAVYNNCTFLNNAAVGTVSADGDAIYHKDEGFGFNGVGGDADHARRTRVENCLFYGSGGNAEIADSGDGTTADETGFEFINTSIFDTDENGGHMIAESGNIVADPLVGSDAKLTSASPAINAGAVITGIHDQTTPATDLAGTSIITVPDIGAYEYTDQRTYFNPSAADGGNGTRQFPFNAWTDYVWTGYNLRAGAEIIIQGAMGSLDLSGLTDTGAITVKPWPGKVGHSVTGFVGNGPDTVLQLVPESKGLFGPLYGE